VHNFLIKREIQDTEHLMNSTFFTFINIKCYGFFMFCFSDALVGGLGGAFLPHPETTGPSKIATEHIKTKPLLKYFFIFAILS